MNWLARPAALFRPAPAADPMLAALNAARAAHGLPALATHPTLVATASGWAARMARRGRLEHGDFAGRLGAAMPGVACSECVAEGYPDAASCVAGWLAEPDVRPPLANHRGIVLGGATHCGWGVARGVARGGAGVNYWAVDFAKIGG